MIPLMQISFLRRTVKHLMIDTGQESIKELAHALGINSRSLTMALTGYRAGPAYERYLQAAHTYLISLPQPGNHKQPPK